MPIVSLTEWNQFLQSHPNAHLLQTGEWGELKSAFGWDSVRLVSGEAGVQILFRKLPLGLTVGYIPKPVLSKSLLVIGNLFWQEIDAVCGRQHAIFLKLEPDLWEGDHPTSQFQISPHNIQPPRTIIVDIQGSEDEILARMKQKTRYNIRLAEKKGVTVRAWNDLEAFHKMMLLTGGRDGFGIHSLEYYKRAYKLLHPRQMGELLVAEYEGKPLAALFVARNGNRAYYLYGASTDEERNRMPTYLLQWKAMKWAKQLGCDEYDLWGVPDETEATLEANFENRSDSLWGVYRFKRGFGGELKRAMQARDRVYNPLLYWAYLRFMGAGEGEIRMEPDLPHMGRGWQNGRSEKSFLFRLSSLGGSVGTEENDPDGWHVCTLVDLLYPERSLIRLDERVSAESCVEQFAGFRQKTGRDLPED